MPQRKVKTLMNCNVTKVAKLQWIVRLQTKVAKSPINCKVTKL